MGTSGWSKVAMFVELEKNPTTRTVWSPTLRTEWGTMAGTSAISPAETRPCSSPTETSAVPPRSSSISEKDRYVRLYARGHLSEEDRYLHDLANEIGSLRLLLESIEGHLAAREQDRLAANSAEAWLMTLQERVVEVEADTEEARRKRRELVRLLVEKITVSRTEDGSTEVQITYRFSPPREAADNFSHGEADFTSSGPTRWTERSPG